MIKVCNSVIVPIDRLYLLYWDHKKSVRCSIFQITRVPIIDCHYVKSMGWIRFHERVFLLIKCSNLNVLPHISQWIDRSFIIIVFRNLKHILTKHMHPVRHWKSLDNQCILIPQTTHSICSQRFKLKLSIDVQIFNNSFYIAIIFYVVIIFSKNIFDKHFDWHEKFFCIHQDLLNSS